MKAKRKKPQYITTIFTKEIAFLSEFTAEIFILLEVILFFMSVVVLCMMAMPLLLVYLTLPEHYFSHYCTRTKTWRNGKFYKKYIFFKLFSRVEKAKK